jgi:hypothetical protein
MTTSHYREQARPLAVAAEGERHPPRANGAAPSTSSGAAPDAWPWSVGAGDLARLDRFVSAIQDNDLRDAARAVVTEGLRRRYRLSQVTCGYSVERYEGLLGLLLEHLQSSVAAREGCRAVGPSGGGNSLP